MTQPLQKHVMCGARLWKGHDDTAPALEGLGLLCRGRLNVRVLGIPMPEDCRDLFGSPRAVMKGLRGSLRWCWGWLGSVMHHCSSNVCHWQVWEIQMQPFCDPNAALVLPAGWSQGEG